jgi:hypothetical protein
MGAAYDSAVVADTPHAYWKLNERENLLAASEDFSAAAWTQPSGAVTVTTGVEADPSGTSAVNQVVFPAVGRILRQAVSPTAAATFSLWARVTTGTATLTVSLRGGGTYSFQVTTDMRRYEISLPSASVNTNFDLTGTANVNFRIWGAQINYGIVASGYVKTTVSAVPATAFADSSGNARTLTRLATGNGLNAFTMGIPGPDYTDYGLYLASNGSVNPLIANSNAVWNKSGTSPLSVEFWLKPHWILTLADIISNNTSGTFNWGLKQGADGCFDGNAPVTPRYRPAEMEWHHYVFTWDGAGNNFLYKDGVQVSTNPNAAAIVGATPGNLNIGAGTFLTGQANLYQGGIACVAVYGTALSSARVLAHYSAMTNVDASLMRQMPLAAPDRTAQVAPNTFSPNKTVGQPNLVIQNGSAARGNRRVFDDGVVE